MCRLCGSTTLVSKLLAIHIFHNFIAFPAGVPRFRGARSSLHRAVAERGLCCSICSRSKVRVALFALFARGASSVWVCMCAEQMCSWITCGWIWDVSTEVTWVSVNILNDNGWMYCFVIELHAKPVTNISRTKKNLKGTRNEPIWGASPTSAASEEKTLLTWNPSQETACEQQPQRL